MLKINWDEYKEFKKHRQANGDNFTTLLEFVKSYYNMVNPREMFEVFKADGLAEMMLEKRDIKDAEDLENFLFKKNHA